MDLDYYYVFIDGRWTRIDCGPFDVREAYPLIDDVAARDGWLDPEMDIYDELYGDPPTSPPASKN